MLFLPRPEVKDIGVSRIGDSHLPLVHYDKYDWQALEICVLSRSEVWIGIPPIIKLSDDLNIIWFLFVPSHSLQKLSFKHWFGRIIFINIQQNTEVILHFQNFSDLSQSIGEELPIHASQNSIK